MLNSKPSLITVLILCYFQLTSIANNDPGRFHFTGGQHSVDIPFYTFNNQVILSVLINDKVPLNFILDSGTSQALFFDRKLATELGIGLGRRIQFSGVGSNNLVTAFRTRGVKLALPGVEGTMMGMAVLSKDYLDMKRFDIHGIIGYQLFARFAVKINYQTRTLSLMEPDQYKTSGFKSLPLEIKQSKPYLTTSVDLFEKQNVDLRLLIDTGGSFGLSLISGSHSAIRPPKQLPKVWVGAGLGGDIEGCIGKATLRMGKDLSTVTEAIFVSHKKFSKKGNDPEKSGSIGNDLFNNYVVIFDYVNARLLLQPHSPTYHTGNYQLPAEEDQAPSTDSR